MSKKVFHNDLVTIRKNKLTLTLNKPAYMGMCILELNKVLMYEFHYNYIKNKYRNNSKLLLTVIVFCMIDFYKDFSYDIKKCLTLVFIQLSQNIIID